MNQYGAMALEHWQRWKPEASSQVADPMTFFEDLGDFAAQEIAVAMGVALSPTEATDPVAVEVTRRMVESELLPGLLDLTVEAAPLDAVHSSVSMMDRTSARLAGDEELPIDVGVSDPILTRWEGLAARQN